MVHNDLWNPAGLASISLEASIKVRFTAAALESVRI
jgi:hypothetical protein